MTAQRSAVASDASAASDYAPLTLDGAHDYVQASALRATPLGQVGFELEGHLVDLANPQTRVSWQRINSVLAALPALPGGSRVTVEPGGQLELSTPPLPGTGTAIDALRRDENALRAHLRTHALGVAHLGADPARPTQRVNPGSRYAAMESYFAATGNATAGAAMMCSTASLQINLEAGPATAWPRRVRLAHTLGPVLVAISACSPVLAGKITGWRSSRQRVWGELDRARCGPLLAGEKPAEEWATYTLCAPVMLIRDPVTGATEPMRESVPFSSWVKGVDGTAQLSDRAPTQADLDYHLTTLFPPVRLRGFLEIRYLDTVPAPWWPALAAITVALFDNPVAADLAAAATEKVAGQWTAAARDGLANPLIAAAARSCLDAAVSAVPTSLKPDVERYAELVYAGRTPGDDVLERAQIAGPLAVLAEYADA